MFLCIVYNDKIAVLSNVKYNVNIDNIFII